MLKWLLLWIALASLWDFILMGVDKRRARRDRRRIRERTFFLVALAGGSPGAIAGMYVFRHKTRHWYFRWGLPALLAAQLALGVWLYAALRP